MFFLNKITLFTMKKVKFMIRHNLKNEKDQLLQKGIKFTKRRAVTHQIMEHTTIQLDPSKTHTQSKNTIKHTLTLNQTIELLLILHPIPPIHSPTTHNLKILPLIPP